MIVCIFYLFLQFSDTQLIEGKKFQGYLFSEDSQVFVSIENSTQRFTPQFSEIKKVEHMLRGNICHINQYLENQGDDCPIIHKNLRKYMRQYVGFINDRGEKILWVNLFWNKTLESKASKEIIFMIDGCSYYWDIEVNLTTEELSNLNVNGKG